MKITVQSSKIVKPASGGGSSSDGEDTTPPATTVDVVPLTVFDEVHLGVYMSSIHAFLPPAPSNAALEAGLAAALAEYREWAGRLAAADDPSTGGRPAILLNDAGARFVEATADVALDAAMPLLRPAAPEVRRLHPRGDDGTDELMLVQVTRFACGSIVVGHTMHHAVGDGFAICQCLLAWGQATRGAAVDPVPVRDRTSFFVPRDPPRIEFQHRGAEFKAPSHGEDENENLPSDTDDAGAGAEVATLKVRFSSEFVSELKSQAAAGGTPRTSYYSTMQCVTAHLWRCMTRARRLDGGVATRLHVAVNGRGRMGSPRPVPAAYGGNVVLWARPAATARELLAGPGDGVGLRHAAEAVRRGVARVDGAYFRSFIDFMSSGAVETEGLVPMADAAESPDAEVYCLRRVPFYDLDFGGGRQVLFMPSYEPVDGLIYILPPSPLGDGGVEAQVSLFSRDMDAFKDCCYSIKRVPQVLL